MPAMCVDLKTLFDDRYKIKYDECAEGRNDPWGYEIYGRRGRVYPHGGELLGIEVERRWASAKELKRRGYPLHQDGDTEMTYLVPASDLDSLADVLELPRRRKLSDEHKAKLLEVGQPFRFASGSNASSNEPGRDEKGKDDSGVNRGDAER